MYSAISNFRFNLDQYLRQISGSNSTSCLLFLPLGSTSVLHRTMHCVGRSNDIVSIGYWTDNATLKVDIHPSNHLSIFFSNHHLSIWVFYSNIKSFSFFSIYNLNFNLKTQRWWRKMNKSWFFYNNLIIAIS